MIEQRSMHRPGGVTHDPSRSSRAGAGAPAIEVRALVKRYRGGVRALDGVSFEVARGTVFALVGPNGAGKSTTVKVLATLARADGGWAAVSGARVAEDPERVRRAVGVVAQRSAVDPDATAQENLLLQGRLQGLRGRAATARAAELLDRFGLGDAAHRRARRLSGGMQRRLDIALGLVHRPRVLLLDEPTAMLDPEVRAALWRDARRLVDDEGLSVLLTTHYLEEADRLADVVGIIDGGRIVATGPPAGLKRELRGDALRLTLGAAASRDAVQGVLSAVRGVHDVAFLDGVVHARAHDGAAAVPAVLAAFEAAGLAVAAATVARPSLEDVYLRHAGRRLAPGGEAVLP